MNPSALYENPRTPPPTPRSDWPPSPPATATATTPSATGTLSPATPPQTPRRRPSYTPLNSPIGHTTTLPPSLVRPPPEWPPATPPAALLPAPLLLATLPPATAPPTWPLPPIPAGGTPYSAFSSRTRRIGAARIDPAMIQGQYRRFVEEEELAPVSPTSLAPPPSLAPTELSPPLLPLEVEEEKKPSRGCYIYRALYKGLTALGVI